MVKGIREERELVQLLWKNGFAVLRAPSSGSSTHMPRPDIIAGDSERGVQFAFEVKTTHSETLYISHESAGQLVEFARVFGCQPIIAIRFKGSGASWIFVEPQILALTPAQNYKITLKEALQRGMDFKSLIKESKQTRLP